MLTPIVWFEFEKSNKLTEEDKTTIVQSLYLGLSTYNFVTKLPNGRLLCSKPNYFLFNVPNLVFTIVINVPSPDFLTFVIDQNLDYLKDVWTYLREHANNIFDKINQWKSF